MKTSIYNVLAKLAISFILGIIVIGVVSGLVKQHAAEATANIQGQAPTTSNSYSYSATVQQGGY